MWKWAPGLFLLAATGACGGASVVLKSPIEERCTEAGLRGCPALAEGIAAYADGDKAEAQTQIVRAAAENSPAELKDFADKLRTLREVPGAADYAAPVLEVADLLVASAAKAEPPPDAGRRRRVSGAPETAPPAPALPSRWEYLVETLPRADASDRLASLGKKGWELVAAAPEADGILCVLKRPRPLDY